MKHQSICLVLTAITLAGCGCSPSQASTTSSSASSSSVEDSSQATQSSTGGGGAVSVQSNVSIHVHVPGEALEENRVEPTCTEAGHYDLVVYCEECGEELSRETISLSAGHSFGVPTYAWNADYSECTATRVCEKERPRSRRERDRDCGCHGDRGCWRNAGWKNEIRCDFHE